MRINSLPLPLECIQHILSFNSPKDKCRFSQAARDLQQAADSNPVWDDYLKEGYKSYQTGESAKDTFRDNLLSIDYKYLNLHKKTKEICIYLNRRINIQDPKAEDKLVDYILRDPESASIILNDEKFYRLILDSPDTIMRYSNPPSIISRAACLLFRIAESHPELASIILNDEKFYGVILNSSLATTILRDIACSNPKSASIIFSSEKFYRFLVGDSSAGDGLTEIAESHPKSASIILSDEKFYDSIINLHLDPVKLLTDIAKSHPKSASIIINNEKFYRPILNSPSSLYFLSRIVRSDPAVAEMLLSEEIFYNEAEQKDIFYVINKYYLKTYDKADRETLLKKLKQIQANNASSMLYIA